MVDYDVIDFKRLVGDTYPITFKVYEDNVLKDFTEYDLYFRFKNSSKDITIVGSQDTNGDLVYQCTDSDMDTAGDYKYYLYAIKDNKKRTYVIGTLNLKD